MFFAKCANRLFLRLEDCEVPVLYETCVQEDIVKLQVLNLAVRLYLTNREQCAQLVQYVFTLARYDKSYDLRDRARFLRNLVCEYNFA